MTGAELARVVHEIADLHPDLILHYSGGNDGWLPFDHDPRPNYPYNFLVHELNPLFDTPGHGRRALLAVAGESNLVRSVLGVRFIDWVVPRLELKVQAGCYTDSWRQRIAEFYVNNLVRSQQVAQAVSARSVAVLQPHTCYPEVLGQSGIEKVNTSPALVNHFAQVREMILELAQQAAVDDALELHDMSLLFREREPVIFTDSVHVLQEAHPVIAARLCDLLAPSIDARVYKPGGPTLAPERERRRWNLWSTDEAKGRIAVGKEPGAMRIDPAGDAGAAADLRMARRLLPACAGRRYAIQFRVRADRPRTVRVAIPPAASYVREDALSQELSLETEWQTVRIQFQAAQDHQDLQIELQLGGDAAAVEITEVAWECLDSAHALPKATSDGSNDSPAIVRAALAREASWYLMAPNDRMPTVDFPDERPGTVRVTVAAGQADPAQHFVVHRRWQELARPPGPTAEASFLMRCSPAHHVMATAPTWKTPWIDGRGNDPKPVNIELGQTWQFHQLRFPTPSGQAVSLGFSMPLTPLRWEIDELHTSAESAWQIQAEIVPTGP